jgi:calcineurin-like phosphoesterase family protein
MEFGGKMILGQHIPPLHPAEIPVWCDFVICGHVHERWSYRYNYEDINIPVINVGVDVRNFRPLSTSEVLKIYDQIIKRC